MKPGKPGFANRCPTCSEPESSETVDSGIAGVLGQKGEREVNAARRSAIRNLLYRQDS